MKNRVKVIKDPYKLEIQISMYKQWFILIFMFIALTSFWSGFPRVLPHIYSDMYRTFKSIIVPLIFLTVAIVASLFVTYIWVWNAFGKEIVIITEEFLIIKRNLGFTKKFLLKDISNLRASGIFGRFNYRMNTWGLSGGTISFENKGKTYHFGIQLNEKESLEVVNNIKTFKEI